ncbi:efflux RND transporter permease subunit [Desulfonema magnum]|uniref:Membrane transport protein domain-containing protein n=1 Tax=Desulfonema magnum TaxID=45655 RepID=A0A975GKD9_9BACT|nr:MMPL family transporter [Desulfonema magnum]QTA84611.1 Membrane transport protein domain-containing protein [Desulfonema magnum]
MKKLYDLYYKYIFDRPIFVIICLLIVMSVMGYKAKDFQIDASAESLLLENDEDLRYTRKINTRYDVYDFLVISYTPKDNDLLSDNTLENLSRLREELENLEGVSSVLSILDVPLLESPPVSYTELSEGKVRKLTSSATDRTLARTELRESYFYRNLIVSEDMTTTALMVNLRPDEIYENLSVRRNEYLEKQAEDKLSEAEAAELRNVVREIRQHLNEVNKVRHENITAIREIMDKYRPGAELFLGGISMISDDMISFIKSDLKTFGLGVFILLVVMLGIIFKRFRWIILPMLCCFFSVIAMMGVLGMFGWEVTVISSNFVSLQLIITLAIVVHLIVRYREFLEKNPESDQRTLVQNTVRTKIIPCLYAAMTTIAGFSSLLLCDILPVINFGWMMSAGILLSLVLTFILFPAGAVLLKKENPPNKSERFQFSMTGFFARFTESNGTLILIITGVVFILSVMGISRLQVENSFIDYFKDTTEIYGGMSVIDQKLGGTTPLDVIVKFEDAAPEDSAEADEDDAFIDAFDDTEEDESKYWFTDDRMAVTESVHDYLDNLEETGKVLSLGTLLKITRKLNKGESLDSYDLSILYTKLPERYRKLILSPYVSVEHNEVRFTIRIRDSLKTLKRDALLKQIQNDLVNKLELKKEQVHLTGTMVLYNNMLQSLFRSQIMTLGVVALVLMLMFLILFRSLKVAIIALFPNLFSAGVVLGVMGWLNIPLDMMTITIAAISIGIAVDDTIHYIYRFREEIKTEKDYYRTLHRCHGSIGHAMYYTSVTIIIGFSILTLSNFYPSIYFGLFTGLAMLIALIAALTLLPQLLVLFKPFGDGAEQG